MKKIHITSHTADIGLKIEADTLPELFEGALTGMSNILKENYCSNITEFEIKENIDIHSPDRTALLIDFLSEILTLTFTKWALFCRVEIQLLNETTLEAIVSGTAIEEFDEDIKAVTYHEAEVVKNASGKWETNIIFDI